MTARSDASWWQRVQRSLTKTPVDLVFVTAYVLFAGVVVLSDTAGQTVQAILAVALAFFLPGYGLAAALVPSGVARGDWEVSSGIQWFERSYTGFDSVERLALSFGLSVAVLPLAGVFLSLTGLGLGTVQIFAALSVIAVGGTAVGSVRRLRLPPGERYSLSVGTWLETARDGMVATDSRSQQVANVLVVASILVAASALGVAFLGTATSQSYTELQVLSENETGDLVAADYPRTFDAGEPVPMVFTVENEEGQTEEYTVVAVAQRFEERDDELVLTDEQELDRFQRTVEHNETWERQHQAVTDVTGEDVRLTYLLYRGEAPADPDAETAYRNGYVWVSVEEPVVADFSGG